MSFKQTLLKYLFIKNLKYKRMCEFTVDNFIGESDILISKYGEYQVKCDVLKLQVDNIKNHLISLKNAFSKKSITNVFMLYMKEKTVFQQVVDSCNELEQCKQNLTNEYSLQVSELNRWITLHFNECKELIKQINDTCQPNIWEVFEYTDYEITVSKYKELSAQYSQMVRDLMNVSAYIDAYDIAQKNITVLTDCKNYMNQIYNTKNNIDTFRNSYRQNMFEMDREFINVRKYMNQVEDRQELIGIKSSKLTYNNDVLKKCKFDYAVTSSKRDLLRKMADDFNKPDWFNLNRISTEVVQELKVLNTKLIDQLAVF